MKRRCGRLLCLAFMFHAIMALCACDNAESGKVQAVFQEYMAAMAASDGQKAVVLIDQRSLDYYEDVRRAILNEGPLQIQNRPPMDRMTIAVIRAHVDMAYINQLSAAQFFSYYVQQGWNEEDEGISISDIRVNGNTAKATIVLNGRSSPFYFEFIREDGHWRMDVTAVFSIVNRGLSELARSRGIDEDALILEAASIVSEKEITATIWEKPNFRK